MLSVKTVTAPAALAVLLLVPTAAGTNSRPSTQVLNLKRLAAGAPQPRLRLTAGRMRPRRGAIAPGTRIPSRDLFTDRVFESASNGRAGFALANDGEAQYPASTRDGGRTWHIDGPQLHVDAADGPEGVGYVGIARPKTLFAYGSSVVDVSTDGGRSWWETFMGELVMAVVPGPSNALVAYVQQSVSNDHINPAVTWQYVSRDGGRHWRYSTALGAFR